jgi:hypothetical protein
MQRRQFNQSTTLEERLIGLARRVRTDVETLPPCKKRDNLVQKLREIETAVDFDQLLRFYGSNRE